MLQFLNIDLSHFNSYILCLHKVTPIGNYVSGPSLFFEGLEMHGKVLDAPCSFF